MTIVKMINYRSNKSTKNRCIEIVKIEKKVSIQQRRYASDRENKQVRNNPPTQM